MKINLQIIFSKLYSFSINIIRDIMKREIEPLTLEIIL